MLAGARTRPTAWARRAPAWVLALLALVGHLVQAVHFAAHAHVYCPLHERMEHAGAVHGAAVQALAEPALAEQGLAEQGGEGPSACPPCGHRHHAEGGAAGPKGEPQPDPCGHAHGGDGEPREGGHDACGMQPPGKLADLPRPVLGACCGGALAVPARVAPADGRHGLEPLILAPKHSPPS